jgi:hypothetical protein
MELWLLDASFYGSLVAIVIPIILLLARYPRLTIELKVLTFLLCFSLLCDVAADILYHLKIQTNYASSLWAMFGTVLYLTFFYFTLRMPSLKPVMITLGVLYLTYWAAIIHGGNFLVINARPRVLTELIVMTFSIIYYYKLIRELPTRSISTLPMFWIISSIFITNSAKLAIYAASEYLIEIHNDNLVLPWFIHNILSTLGSLTIGWGAWLNFKEKSVHQSYKK